MVDPEQYGLLYEMTSVKSKNIVQLDEILFGFDDYKKINDPPCHGALIDVYFRGIEKTRRSIALADLELVAKSRQGSDLSSKSVVFHEEYEIQ